MVRSRRARRRFDSEMEKENETHASLPGTEKSLWEHYNELRAKLDAKQQALWHDAANTALVFSGLVAAVLSIFLGIALQELKPDNDAAKMMLILNQISNQLRNTSDPVPESSEDGPSWLTTQIVDVLTTSLGLISLTIIIALLSKYALWAFFSSSGMHHNPEEQARNRESSEQHHVLGPVATLSLFMMLSGTSFISGCYSTMFQLSKFATRVFIVAYTGTFLPIMVIFSLVGGKRWYLKGIATHTLGRRMISAFSRALALVFDVLDDLLDGRSPLDPEIVVGISNCLFIHTPMVPTNVSIFIQLFAIPVEHSRCRITSLEDFTTRIVEFLQGVVVYLAKCPNNDHNGDLLRTATIMAAEWLVSRQTSDNGNLPRRYILSRQDVDSDEENQEMFVLVYNRRLSPSERLQRTITLYQGSQKTDSRSDFVIRTLLIPIMAIESFAVEKEGKSTPGAVPCNQRDDLRCSLEGLWDLWEAGFNQSDLLRFVLELVVPPSSTEGATQSSMIDLLLNEYLQQINRSPAQITEKAFRFIGATLEHSLTTGTTKDELDLQLRDFRSLDPWLSLHVDNILGRRSTPYVAALERVTTLDSRVRAIVARKRLNLYLSSTIEPEPDILTLLVQSDDPAISLEAFGQGLNLSESPPTDEPGGRNPGSPRPFTFALLKQDKRSHLISRLFDPQQSASMYQSVWILFAEDLFPRWELLPADWRRDIATALVAATEWMEKGQRILAKEINQWHGNRASGKAKQLIGATILALVNHGDIGHHWKRTVSLEARDERFQERLDACAQIYLRLFASAIEELGESAKPHTQDIVNFLVDLPDVLYNRDSIKRIQHILGISRRM